MCVLNQETVTEHLKVSKTSFYYKVKVYDKARLFVIVAIILFINEA